MLTIIEREAEDAAFLWIWRANYVRAPNVRLIDLVRLDERLDAHVDALRVSGEVALTFTQKLLDQRVVGAVFAWTALTVPPVSEKLPPK
jgi:hypothetical protein